MSDLNSTNPIIRPRLREALDKVRPEMAALDDDDLIAITVDPLAAASTARGALPQIMPLRDVLAKLPGFNISYLDKLETYALASMQTQTIFQGTNVPPEHLQELVAEAAKLRELLLSDAQALAKRGYISSVKLDTLKGPVGFRNVASDIMTLANMLRTNWDAIVGKTCVTPEELDRAEILGDQLINDIGVRELAPVAMATVAKERQQSFTLFVTAYDQVRRGVGFIRWDAGDADEIAPSLYAGRRRKGGTDLDKTTETVPATTPATSPTTTTPAASPANAAGAAKPGIGLPGSDPFVH